ncbi:tRNA dihydrouridine synthase [Fusibacter bizertensis]
MKYYLAPLEGVTNYIYRNAYHTHFEKLDKYYTPFISTNQHNSFSTKDLKEILPENNKGLYTVPQILSNNSVDFIKAANTISSYGYNEINLNLGCPSNTVVAKNKGSGFLYHTEALDRFLDEIYSQATMKISIKTRLGKYSADEFYELVKIYSKYPLEELIIHPRIQKDMYRNVPNLEVFSQTLASIKCPVCYNGDIFTTDDYQSITDKFPTVDLMMLGRGIIGNPALIGQIKNESMPDIATFRSFHDTLYQNYKEVMHGEKNILYKMKSLWFYMIHIFSDNKKVIKSIKKCERLSDYDLIIEKLFSEHELAKNTRGYRVVVENL